MRALAAAIALTTMSGNVLAWGNTTNNIDQGAGEDITNNGSQQAISITNNIDQGAGGGISNNVTQIGHTITNNIENSYDDSHLAKRIDRNDKQATNNRKNIRSARDDIASNYETMIDRTQSNKGFISRVNTKAESAQATADNAHNAASQNADDIEATNAKVASNGTALGQHEGRIAANASTNGRQDEEIGTNTRKLHEFNAQTNARLGQHATAIKGNRYAIEQLRDEVGNVRGDLEAGVAGAYAAAGHAWQVGPDAPFQMSLSGGAYRGANAASLGFGGQASDNMFLSGSVAQDSRGNTGGNVAVNFQFR